MPPAMISLAAAPAGHLDRLRRHHIDHAVLGDDRVDLGGALSLLADRHGVGAVRVDAGGGLNGALLRAGLSDQVSIVIAPYLAASAAAGPLRLITCPGCPDAVALELTAVERLRQGHVWLRYDVRGGPVPPGPDFVPGRCDVAFIATPRAPASTRLPRSGSWTEGSLAVPGGGPVSPGQG